MKKFACYLTATFGSFHRHCNTDFTLRHDGYKITQVLFAEGYQKFMLLCAVIFFALRPKAGSDLIHEVSRSHSDAPQSVGHLLTSDRLVAHLTAHNIHNRQTSMPPAGFEPTISAAERLQTHALDRAATGTGYQCYYSEKFRSCCIL
jgi:hypothetical protein